MAEAVTPGLVLESHYSIRRTTFHAITILSPMRLSPKLIHTLAQLTTLATDDLNPGLMLTAGNAIRNLASDIRAEALAAKSEARVTKDMAPNVKACDRAIANLLQSAAAPTEDSQASTPSEP